jgi:NADH-quinone oxidoreductase subunit M
MTPLGMRGAMFQMIAHGVSSAMMFFLVGVVYDRAHHRDIARFGGLQTTMPVYFGLATVGFFAAMGLPGLCGFIGEAFVLIGTFGGKIMWAKPFAVVAALGVILTAGYILWTIQRVFLGPEKPEYQGMEPISSREIAVLAPMAFFAILLGILPQQTLIRYYEGTIDVILKMLT